MKWLKIVFNNFLHLFVATSSRRKVMMDMQKVTIISDLDVCYFISLDKYFQFIFKEGWSMSDACQEIHDGTVVIKTMHVVLLMGNQQVPMPMKLSPVNQMRKLVQGIFVKYGRRIEKIYVGTVFLHPDREVEMEVPIKQINKGFASAVRGSHNHNFEKKRVSYFQLHKLFLERFRYVDVLTGHDANHLRVVKPVSTYFQPGTSSLNALGHYHIKSYILQYLGVLEGVNSWDGIPDRHEPKEIRDQKKAAWMATHG